MIDELPEVADADPILSPTRRTALRLLGAMVASPVVLSAGLAGVAPRRARGEQQERPGTIRLPEYAPEVMAPVNLHDFEAEAIPNLSQQAYDYIAAGAADELTLNANREAYSRYWIRRGVMRDVSVVDTSIELFGQRLEHPILLGPVGLRSLLNPDGHILTARAAHNTGTILVGPGGGSIRELSQTGEAPRWWASTLGHSAREQAAEWAARSEDQGASALCLSVDYPYTGARDRPSRRQWEREWSRGGTYSTEGGNVAFQAGMLDPYTADLSWSWLDWARSGSQLPIVIKGLQRAEDAKVAVERGAGAIVVSNHGGRTLDGMGGTLDNLPAVVEAVDGRIPVLVDGGIRRGGDVLKALALGARAVLIGRPYLWGLAAFGQDGVQRVVELLQGELRIALGLSGFPNPSAIDRTLVQRAWRPSNG